MWPRTDASVMTSGRAPAEPLDPTTSAETTIANEMKSRSPRNGHLWKLRLGQRLKILAFTRGIETIRRRHAKPTLTSRSGWNRKFEPNIDRRAVESLMDRAAHRAAAPGAD